MLPDWQRLLERFPQWQSLLLKLSPQALGRHGDYTRWCEAIQMLPELNVDSAEFTDRVTVHGSIDGTVRNQLIDALLKLHPWRKGPFELFGVHIDSEWRSDWKWRRLAPHLGALHGGSVLDVGCGNGYFGWRALQAGAELVVGVDPTLLFFMQHLAICRYLPDRENWLLPIGFEDLPPAEFDLALSMGVIYHRRDPVEHIAELMRCTRPGGTLVLESLVVQGSENLAPEGRYARMRNVHLLPTPDQMKQWLQDAGAEAVTVVDTTATSTDEQRSTPWMRFESLSECLDADNPACTVEGLPAPVRTIVIARRPA